jgi:thiamine biosynthesis protein ThiS
MSEIRVLVNGESRTIPGPVTLSGLLAALELDPRLVVVELNREIVRRPRLAEISLSDGDQVELVHFVGGG